VNEGFDTGGLYGAGEMKQIDIGFLIILDIQSMLIIKILIVSSRHLQTASKFAIRDS